jgi:hypothetical protein
MRKEPLLIDCLPERMYPPTPVSSRYLKLLQTGAREWELEGRYRAWLDGLESVPSRERGPEYYTSPSGNHIKVKGLLHVIKASWLRPRRSRLLYSKSVCLSGILKRLTDRTTSTYVRDNWMQRQSMNSPRMRVEAPSA